MTSIIKTKQAIVLKEKANIELWNKNYTSALNLFTEALELDPENIEYHLSRAAVYNLSGLFSNAIKECKITLEKGNKIRKEKSKGLSKKEEEEEGEDGEEEEDGDGDEEIKEKKKRKKEIEEIDSILSKAYARMGSAYLGANQLKESRTCIESAIVIQQCQEFDEMLQMIDDLIDFSTTEAKNLFRLANDSYYAKKYQEAIELYTEAIEIDQRNNILFSNRSMCFNKLKRYQEALEDAQKAIDIENRDSHHSYLPRYAKGNSLYFLGRYQEALESYQDSLKNKPDSPVLLKKIKKTLLKLESSSINKNKNNKNNTTTTTTTLNDNNINNNNNNENNEASSSSASSSSATINNNKNENNKKVKKSKKQSKQQIKELKPQNPIQDQIPTKSLSSIISPPPLPSSIDKSSNSIESNLETSTQLQEDYELTMVPDPTSPSKQTFVKTNNLQNDDNNDDEDDGYDENVKLQQQQQQNDGEIDKEDDDGDEDDQENEDPFKDSSNKQYEEKVNKKEKKVVDNHNNDKKKEKEEEEEENKKKRSKVPLM
ncbi:hypothetical protein DDB_G0289669 [Dictyostelium discoideum AX4]|uniref:TPR-like protein n=1 Tax=Dictyostelium discoideum TaxID=44689 RepID=Q54H74_DICDI|nr:hypothetical protein DDB_G0289669 [Dictyostelium discoideum AX4]EAL62546.1 hypothetical protein DDB_G0289669 [Dictyostelium discoideum AX4]|eukprot:XP_636044.1 hypothetical protein DDB_G0289669 [Dictyostelium discoideum AX4]